MLGIFHFFLRLLYQFFSQRVQTFFCVAVNLSLVFSPNLLKFIIDLLLELNEVNLGAIIRCG